MATELKASVINMKSLSQDIKDPIIIGSSESNGRTLRIIFTQEAAAQFTPNTLVYLSWRHIQKNVKGYNVFTDVTTDGFPPTWEIHYPKQMLHEGDVLANIELVDEISVSSSVTFNIHVLAEAWDGREWIEEDSFDEFKKAMSKAQNAENEYNELVEKMHEYLDMFDIIDYPEDPNTQEIKTDDDLVIIDWTGGDEENG